MKLRSAAGIEDLAIDLSRVKIDAVAGRDDGEDQCELGQGVEGTRDDHWAVHTPCGLNELEVLQDFMLYECCPWRRLWRDRG